MDNPELLRRVMELGVTLDTAPAFLLAPLVQVAWAEGEVTEREHKTVLRLAGARGVEESSPAHAQLLAVAPGASTGRSLRHGNGGHQARALGPAAW